MISGSEWSRIIEKAVPERDGSPTIGCDLGSSRSFSAACAVWPNGRVESFAIAPGQPSLDEQEKEDQLPPGSYLELVESGGLTVDGDRAVPSPESLLARIWAWNPRCVIADGYRADELRSAIAGRCSLVERGRGSSETASNVASLRSLLLDGAGAISEESRELLAFGLKQTAMTIGADGVTRVVKTRGKRSREDSVAAMLLACGHAARRPAPVELRGAVISKSGKVTWL